uniref:N-acetyl-transferase n=1 Tax=Hirsutella thompsonii TaxID=42368 RepID=A0A3G2ZP52_HIRTH|nr:N-acetyl-transferase [Hirsutella thompsonii]AYP41291.1 N-acetyl-transferase [Hirsutella thompsonii]AYP41320.1 N-acetyl-transferase [Hirsutella thompsonii]
MSTIVITTQPLLKKGTLHFPILTDRLIIRPLVLSDLDAFHSLRIQPEAMAHSGQDGPDTNIDQTLAELEILMQPYPHTLAYCGVFLKNSDGYEGELIGDGGMWGLLSKETGWPVFGYKFKKEHWGLGYATEFATAYMQFWWGIARTQVKTIVASCTVNQTDELQVVPEQMYAWTTKENKASQRVLHKVGFRSFEGLDNGLINWRLEKDSWFFFLFLANC